MDSTNSNVGFSGDDDISAREPTLFPESDLLDTVTGWEEENGTFGPCLETGRFLLLSPEKGQRRKLDIKQTSPSSAFHFDETESSEKEIERWLPNLSGGKFNAFFNESFGEGSTSASSSSSGCSSPKKPARIPSSRQIKPLRSQSCSSPPKPSRSSSLKPLSESMVAGFDDQVPPDRISYSCSCGTMEQEVSVGGSVGLCSDGQIAGQVLGREALSSCGLHNAVRRVSRSGRCSRDVRRLKSMESDLSPRKPSRRASPDGDSTYSRRKSESDMDRWKHEIVDRGPGLRIRSVEATLNVGSETKEK